MSNQHTDMCELVELYALNGLTDDEAAAFEEHLKDCAVCRNQLIELKLVVNLLPMASEPIEVPQGMRERVLTAVLGESAAKVKVKVPSAEEEAAVNSRKPAAGYYSKEVTDSARAAMLGNVEAAESAGTGAAADEPNQERNTAVDVRGLSRLGSRPDKGGRKARFWRLISLGLAAVICGLGVYSYQTTVLLKGLRTELVAVNNELTGVSKELAAAKAPVLAGGLRVNKIVTLNPAAENIVSKGLASIVIDNKGTHLIVQAENLPQLQQQEVFQVWLIKDNQPVNAGTFSPLDGKGVIYFSFESKDYDTVTITIEPDANGVQPRGTILLAGGLKS
jgi:hypothetical protein